MHDQSPGGEDRQLRRQGVIVPQVLAHHRLQLQTHEQPVREGATVLRVARLLSAPAGVHAQEAAGTSHVMPHSVTPGLRPLAA
eukprot:9474780-Alexandrium_andersonii.AAC.1